LKAILDPAEPRVESLLAQHAPMVRTLADLGP
jgi:hypothetical protein